MNIQAMGTHKAADVPRILAGSKHSNASRRTNQSERAISGGMIQANETTGHTCKKKNCFQFDSI
jgi:hypothetical protein